MKQSKHVIIRGRTSTQFYSYMRVEKVKCKMKGINVQDVSSYFTSNMILRQTKEKEGVYFLTMFRYASSFIAR